jgi:hypothetical protein
MNNRDVAQFGRAPALGAGGPVFESLYPDHFIAGDCYGESCEYLCPIPKTQ